MVDGLLIVVLDDVQDGRNLPGAHAGVEAVVAVPCETDILIRALQMAFIVQDISQLQEGRLIHHSVTDIAQSRLRQPILLFLGRLAAHPAVIADDGIITALGRNLPKPFVADFARFRHTVLLLQLIDPVHIIIRAVVAGNRKERVAIKRTVLIVSTLHGKDLRVIAQLTVDMHLCHVIVSQAHAVELVLID